MLTKKVTANVTQNSLSGSKVAKLYEDSKLQASGEGVGGDGDEKYLDPHILCEGKKIPCKTTSNLFMKKKP